MNIKVIIIHFVNNKLWRCMPGSHAVNPSTATLHSRQIIETAGKFWPNIIPTLTIMAICISFALRITWYIETIAHSICIYAILSLYFEIYLTQMHTRKYEKVAIWCTYRDQNELASAL